METPSITRVRSGSPFEQRYGFCRALRHGDRVEVAGTAPIPRPGEPLATDAYRQTLRCGEIALEALARLGAGPQHVVRTRMFITDPADADEVGRAHSELFGAAPPVTTMVVTQLLDGRWKVELEVEAQLPASAPPATSEVP
ncbi:MAG TPA: RidA family protein [Thermoanaerobaculia bacterium]|jgi:enamine deaminase RidA (YjgF/YER057c/UK114 family)|nr:RidA family protein [Thermoanaerobaculia bacterium]